MLTLSICFLKHRVWFRRTLELAGRANRPDELICRVQYHLARVIRQQEQKSETHIGDDDVRIKKLNEARTLEAKARETLGRLLKYHLPDYLKGIDDELALFDHLQACFRGRWTGRTLLCNIPVV